MSLLDRLSDVSSWIIEWTPLSLLITFLTFSYFLYIVLPSSVNNVLWYLFISLQTAVTISVLAEATHSIRPNVIARREMRKAAKEGFPDLTEDNCPPIDLVLVAYLPNEQDIILRQMRYVLRELDYPSSKLCINVLYNTPRPIEPVESEMKAMESLFPNLRVVKVPTSTSKAENINHYLTLPSRAKIIAIYDTDHYPHRTALRWAARAFLSGEVDIVQGRCCIYNYSETWLTKLLTAEFDTIYGVFHPGRASLHGFGIFGGSNGFWNASLLRSLGGFQKHMLTEDIDCTLRALTSGARISYDLRIKSFETAPATLQALLKQRLRWAQGWTQVTIRHIGPTLRRGAYGTYIRSRLGLFFLLAFRESYFYFPIQFLALLLAYVTTHPPRTLGEFYSGMVGFSTSIWLLFFNLVSVLIVTLITLRNRSDFDRPLAVLAFGFLSPFYFTLVSAAAIFTHFREVIRYEKWNPTARSAPKKTGE